MNRARVAYISGIRTPMETTYLVDMPQTGIGYWGVETSYYMQKGVVYQLNYADGSSQAVFDTGLKASAG